MRASSHIHTQTYTRTCIVCDIAHTHIHTHRHVHHCPHLLSRLLSHLPRHLLPLQQAGDGGADRAVLTSHFDSVLRDAEACAVDGPLLLRILHIQIRPAAVRVRVYVCIVHMHVNGHPCATAARIHSAHARPKAQENIIQ